MFPIDLEAEEINIDSLALASSKMRRIGVVFPKPTRLPPSCTLTERSAVALAIGLKRMLGRSDQASSLIPTFAVALLYHR